MFDLSIIIVNWNAKDVLRVCLNSIIKFTNQHSYEIIVVDNNSTDSSPGMIKEEFPEVKLIGNKSNLGFAAANNQGLQICTGKNILLLNPDTELTEPAIDKLLNFLNNSDYDVVTCKLLNSDGSLQRSVFKFRNVFRNFGENRMINIINLLNLSEDNFHWLPKLWNHTEEKPIDWARGAVILFPRYVYEKIGLLDEQFYIYAEEIDYYLRIKKAGLKAGFTPNVSIIHHGGVSTKQAKVEMVIQNYKSYYRFVRKHHGLFGYYFYRWMVLLDLVMKIIQAKLSGNKNNYSLNKTLFNAHFQKNGL